MGRTFFAIPGAWLLACTALVAADFWTDKDSMFWSDTEVEKMLTGSPWSRHPLLDAPSPSRQLRARKLESGGAGSENRDELKHLSVPPQVADDRDDVGA